MHGSMWRREETGTSRPARAARNQAPPADPTVCSAVARTLGRVRKAVARGVGDTCPHGIRGVHDPRPGGACAPCPGVTGRVEQRDGYVYRWVEDLMVQLTAYPYGDIGEARAAAERLAKERG
jgi:hypothetical protein